jgi:L-alanine-DL-glutamate epimerase-like enolase superfamily enzyme
MVKVPLAKPFVVSLGTIYDCESVFVKIETDAGITGFGEGAGFGFVTGETNESVLGAIRLFEPLLTGQNPFAIEHIHRAMDEKMRGNGSAKAAIDIALYDIMSKAANLPLYQFLGGVKNRVEIDMTIGIGAPVEMAERAAELSREGFREIKVKAGANPADDAEAMRLIRAAAPAVHIKVDANQGWNVSTALTMLREYEKYGVEAVEQPVPYWDIDGLAAVRARSPIPIMADESCFTPQDASAIVRRGAADIINIKLMKCGGLYRAAQINAIAEAAGVRCMLGCMLESRLAIAAAAAFVASRPNVLFADLDSFNDFDDAAFVTRSFDYATPWITLPDAPGIGVEIEF